MTSTDFHQKRAKKPEKMGSGGRRKSNTYLTHGVKKVYFFLSIERYVNDLLRPPSFFNPRPLRRGDSDERTLSKYPIYFNPHPHKGATSGDYLVNRRTAAVNPTAKACFCQSSHSCKRASKALPLTAGASVSNCLCRASGSNKSGSCLHSPSYRASNSGFSFSPP